MEQPTHEDAAERLAQLESDRTRMQAAIVPDPRVIYGLWGAAWLVGFLALWSATVDGPLALPLPAAGVLFAVCIVGAMVFTAVHIARRVTGVRGISSRVGAMYGWAWPLALVALGTIMAGAYRAGLPAATGSLLWTVLSGLVVGTLYLAAGAVWQDSVQYWLGFWILACSAAGALTGFPAVYLVMAIAAGGGFLAASAFFTVRGVRGR